MTVGSCRRSVCSTTACCSAFRSCKLTRKTRPSPLLLPGRPSKLWGLLRLKIEFSRKPWWNFDSSMCKIVVVVFLLWKRVLNSVEAKYKINTSYLVVHTCLRFTQQYGKSHQVSACVCPCITARTWKFTATSTRLFVTWITFVDFIFSSYIVYLMTFL